MLTQRHEGAERRRGFGDRDSDAVIGRLGDDQAQAAGAGAGDPKGQVVRLAARAGEHHLAERLSREFGEKALGVSDDRFVQIAGVGVQHRGLPGQRRHHVRVAMAHGSDVVVVAVEIGLAVRAVEPDAFGAHHVNRSRVEQPIGRAQHLLAPRHEFAVGRRQGLGCSSGE